MAVTPEEIKTTYPLPVYNYKVEIGSDTIAFSEASGMNIQFEPITFKESPTNGQAGPHVFHMPGQGTAANLTLKKGMVCGTSVATLYNWINSIQLNQVDKKDIYIRLCDEQGNTVISWKVVNAFPTQLDAPTFDANANDVAVETMTLMADALTIVDETA